MLASHVFQYVHLVRMEEGRLEIRLGEHAPAKLPQDLGAQLLRLTGRRWMPIISNQVGEATLAEKKQNARHAEFAETLKNPGVAQILALFPGAQLTDITDADDTHGAPQ
jgi:DNA polymerase-3 subunit gamma/tau